MKFSIGSPASSGFETDSLDEFLDHIEEMAEQANAQGYRKFDIWVENWLGPDDCDNNDEYDDDEEKFKIRGEYDG